MVFRVAGSALSVPATKKRYRDEGEAMAEMSSMSESKIQAVIEGQARTKRKQLVNSWISASA